MRSSRRRLVIVPIVAVATVLSLAGCSEDQLHGFLPGFMAGKAPVTNHTQMVSDLWVGSWIVLLVVGIVTWSLILFAAIMYRRRRGATGLPVQLRYNMPIEIFYTVVPLILVLGLFAFTARDQADIEKPYAHPDVTIAAYGHQWAWDFNYLNQKVYSVGVQAQPTSSDTADTGYDDAALPQLVLPINKKIEIELRTRDVNHSFWVIDFLYKKDMIAGQTNYMYFMPTRLGTYEGKCAELCGEYHSRMLFTVRVVSYADYLAYTQQLRAQGNVGGLGAQYDKDNNGAIAGDQNAGQPAGSSPNQQGGNN